MTRALAILPIVLCISAGQASQDISGAPSGRVLVEQYCLGCHNGRLNTAGLSLEGLSLDNIGDNAGTWEKVLRKLTAKEMPPAGLPRPSASAQKQFTDWLESELDKAAAAHPNPGRPTIHRLNRNEYSNAVRDLLALDIEPGDSLPVDDSGYGFDNIGDVLSLSPVLLERYLSVARTVARLAVGNTDVKPVIDTFAPVKEVRAKGRPRTVLNERIGEELPFGSAGGLSFEHAFPVDAEYVFKIGIPGSSAGFGEAAAPIAQILDLRIRINAGVHHVGLTFLRSGAIPEVLPVPTNRGAGKDATQPLTAYLDLRLDGARLKLYEVPEVDNGPAFTDLSIGGPYSITGAGDSPSRRKIFICKPDSGKEEDACARRILSALGRHAFRRALTDADLKSLFGVYSAGRREGSFNDGIEMALRAVLVSPDFLFRVERDPPAAEPGSIHRIGDFELASRLSFFLWSSIPDDQLLDLAGKGALKEPAVLKRQVARMLDDPKSKAFVRNFAGQWLYVRNLAAQKPDPDEFPGFDNALRRAFEQETEMFFQSILREDRPVTELLDANYMFVNQRLAEFYKIPGVFGPQFRRIVLTDADANRRGILGQGSLLTVTSYPNRTSVVQRGKWVLENLLGTPPPPAPPNVPSLDPHGKDGKLSMRQALELHRANPACASCHSRMDPIGFALENYNGIGAWRDRDNGALIDASGTLPGGSTFSGPAGLAHLLLERHRDEFISTFTEKLMTYALGRGIEPYDQPAIRSVIREAAKRNTSIPALIDAIVGSPPFQMRRTREFMRIARRTFLRGIGTTIALPMLDSMVPAAPSAAKRPIRLGFVYVPNGMIPKDWFPKTEGSGFDFMSTMKPLEPFREKLLVLSNLAQVKGRALGDGGGDHARAGATWLTGVHPKKTQGTDIHAGISADQVAAKEMAKSTQFASLEIGIEEPFLAGGCDSGYSCAYTNTISWRGPTTPNPLEISPRVVFERLFGDGETTDAAARARRTRQDRTILDYVRADLARLESGLGARDKSKLDEYLESVRDIERRIQRAEEQSANMNVPVMDRPVGVPDTFEEHARLMADLMVIAWQTDLTRVITFMMAREGSNRSYREIGVSDGHHSVTHHQNDPVKVAKTRKIDELHTKSFAYLVGRLEATKEGEGTLLDNSMLLFGSSIRDGNIHEHHDLPLVLVGGKAVEIRGGRHIRYKPETPMNNLLLTMLDKSGVPGETLGDSTGKVEI